MPAAVKKSEIQTRREIRETALLGIAIPLADEGRFFGPQLCQFTPWHELILLAHGNHFVTGQRLPTVPAVLQYLWLCSPQFHGLSFEPDLTPKKLSWLGRHQRASRFTLFRIRWLSAVTEFRVMPSGRSARFPTERVLRAIEAHGATRHTDRWAPPVEKAAPGAGRSPLAADADSPNNLAYGEFLCRRVLGYTRAEFWHTPFAHTNQLLAVHFSLQPGRIGAPKFDRARDKKNGEYLRTYIAQRNRGGSMPPGPERVAPDPSSN